MLTVFRTSPSIRSSSRIRLTSTGTCLPLGPARLGSVGLLGYAAVTRAVCCRFVQYKATSLEKQHKHELLTEPDLGVTIDLINPDTYRIDPSSESKHTLGSNQEIHHIYSCLLLHLAAKASLDALTSQSVTVLLVMSVKLCCVEHYKADVTCVCFSSVGSC